MQRPIIMTVGSEGGPLKRLEPVLARSHLDVQHVSLASTALKLVASKSPIVMIVSFPLNDLRPEEFFPRLDTCMTSLKDTKVILLADERYLAQLEPHLDERHVLLSPTWNPELLQSYVLSLLPTQPTEPRAAKRLILKLEVEMGNGPRLRLCQSDNISETGMLVRTSFLLPVGTQVRIAITLPSQPQPVQATAEIVRHTDPDREKISGLGLRFRQFKGQGLEALKEYIFTQDDLRIAQNPDSKTP